MLSLSVANGQSASNYASSSGDLASQIFGKAVQDGTAVSDRDWLDFSTLGYANAARSNPTPVRWAPQPLPAVDGINGKVDAFGGDAKRSDGLYGANAALSLPLAYQWGAQIDGSVVSNSGVGSETGGGHVFWRDPLIGLLGAYGSYSRWDGIDVANGHISAATSRVAGEGEYYMGRWTFGVTAGVEAVQLYAPFRTDGIPNRFFDFALASYYPTDNLKLSIGQYRVFGRYGAEFSVEQGFALGSGRMAALFADGTWGERGSYTALAGIRIYFGQHDKSLIERNRQDDPRVLSNQGLVVPTQTKCPIVPPGSPAPVCLHFFAPGQGSQSNPTHPF